MDNKQGPTIEHRELCSVLYGSLDGWEVWGRMDTCICMTESLSCPPETILTLLIDSILCLVAQLCPNLCDPRVAYQAPLPMEILQARMLGVSCHVLLQEIFPTQGLNPSLPMLLLLLLLSRFSCVRLCATAQMAAPQAPPTVGFPRQEHWSGLPFPSPMHESEK